MDLASVLAELKAVDDFKQPDRNLATASFCQRACKVLEKVVKQADVVEFDHLVIGIWIVIGSFNELLPQLVDGHFLTELVEKLFRQCARIVLDIKWQQLDEDEKCRQNFQSSLSSCHKQMAPRGFTRFGVLQELMENPWTDPVLTMVMGSEEDNEEGEGLAYIQAQDPEILKLRVELMQQENCDEFALNLCTWCLKHHALAGDLGLRKTQLVLLHRLSYNDKLQEVCQTVSLEDSITLIKNLQLTEDQNELCTILAQTFLVQNWIRPSDNQGKKELLRLWIKLQHQADRDQDRFIDSLWAVAKVSRSTEQLLLIIDALREQCGDTFLQFYTDLCVFAINVDKGCWEKLKSSTTAGPSEEILARKRDMAQVCDKLSHIVSHVSPKIAFCCALTAFTMLPTEQSLQAVREAYQRKAEAGSSSKSQCCSNCASDQGQCLKNDGDDRESRDVNIATLYEVERLCGMLRPAYLSADSDFSILLTLCRQYLLKENGEAVKSALVRRKSALAVQVPTADSVISPHPLSPDKGHMKPNITKGQASVKTVDAAAHVSNLGTPDINYRSMGMHGAVVNPGSSATRIGQPMVKIEPSEISQQPGRSNVALLNQHQQLNQKIAEQQLNQNTQQLKQNTVQQQLNQNTQQLNQNTVHQQSGQNTVQQQSNQTAVQQLVLQQLSGDMVQALLHLIHSGQISPVTLNQIMSKNPNVSLQVLQNLVTQARQQAHKTSAPNKAQPIQGQQSQGQQIQQQQVQVQQPLQQKQMQPKIQQQLSQRAQQIQLTQTVHHTDIGQQQHQLKLQRQEAQQQRPSQPGYGTSQVAQATNMQQSRLAAQHHQTGIRQVAPQQVLSSHHSATQLSVQQRMQGSQMVMQQARPVNSNSQQPQPSLQRSHQPVLQGVPQVRPVLPAMSTIRLSSTGEIRVTQPVHVMTFRHSTPVQSPSPGIQNPRLLIQTTSQMLTHLSGGSVVSVQQQPQMLNLPSATMTLSSRVATTTSSQATPKLIPKAPGPVFTTHQDGRGSNAASNQTQVSSNSGNRNYSINNLLFTGEQQSNALSITLPDQLPEISVDTISDTLRALSDQPTSGAQALSKGQVNTAHIPPVNQAGSLGTVVPVSSVHTSVNTLHSIQQQPAGSVPTQQPKKSTKKSAPRKSSVSQPEVLNSTVATSHKHLLNPVVSVSSQIKTEPSAQATSKPLPSFSSLFGPNQKPAPLPVSDSTSTASSTLVSTSPSKKGAGGQNKGQGKTQKKTGGEKAANKGKDKGDLMRLLKEVMTIKIEDKKTGGSEPTYVHAPGQVTSSSTEITIKSVVPSRGITSSHSSSLSRPHFQQSSQPGYMSVSSAAHTRPGMASQQLGVNLSVPAPSSSQSAASVASHVPSVASASTVRGAPNNSSTFAAIYTQQLPQSSQPSSSNPSQHSIVSSSAQNTVLTTLASRSLNLTSSTSSAVSFPMGQIGNPAVCYSPTTQLPGFLNAVPTSVVDNSPLKSYSRQDHIKPVWKDSCQDQVISVPIPTSILPEGGIIETGRDGDQSVATYRCIICAMAFMTLDALRLHVKQICKPGFNQPPNLGSRMAFDKAQAMEEGLETSTVFQCMRCFELCISEAGIREHKLVCSKAPKPKTKSKSKAKPKPPKSEAEQATEAKVLELLNKCLGENREKLLEEERNAQLAKQAAAAKKRAKKRPSTDGDSVTSAEGDTTSKPKKTKKETFGSSVETSSNFLPQNSSEGDLMDTAATVKIEPISMTEKLPEPVVVLTPPVPSVTPLHSNPASAPVQNESLPATTGDISVEAKPKPKRKYYPKKKKPAENMDQSVTQTGTDVQAEQSDTTDKGKKSGAEGVPEKGKKPESDSVTETGKKSGTNDLKPARQKKTKKESSPTPPRYKELSSSGGQSFFKCLNCGQTLCSIENFNDHWVECIIKKPLPVKPKCLPKEKKVRAKGGKSDTTTYSSVESIETTIDRVASASYVLDTGDTETFDGSSLKEADITGSDRIVSGADFKEGEKTGEAEQQSNKESTEHPSSQSCEESSALSSENLTEESEIVNELTVVQEAPVVFEAEAGEVINEMQVETTDEEGVSSVPLVKPSLVMLEKVNFVEKVSESCTAASSDSTEGTSEVTPAEKSDDDSVQTSPSVSPSKVTSRKVPARVRNFSRRPRRKPELRSGGSSKRRESAVKKDSSCTPPKIPSPPGGGESKYCSLCKRHFSRRVLLIQHLASRHLQPYTLKKLGDTSSYFCHLCQKTFSQFSGYMAHVNSHSQAIVKQFSESLNKLDSPGRSRRIASQKGTAGQNQKKHGRTSPKDLTKIEKLEDSSKSDNKGRSHPRLRNPVLAEKVKLTPFMGKHRRGSVRAAQKQALSKIFISSLGITSSAEPLKENNKRKISTEEKGATEAKPKRTRADKSKKDEAESDEDEENTEESRGEAEKEDESSAAEAVIDTAATATGAAATASTTSQGAQAAEKASMDASKVQSLSHPGPGKPSLSLQCPQSGGSCLSSSQLPSPLSSVPKKPSFLDSFLNFVSSRSPDAPLPINQSKRRISNMGNLDSQNPATVTLTRSSSCDTPSGSLGQASLQQHPASLSLPTVELSSSVVDQATADSKSTQSTPAVSVSTRRTSSDYDNVYYYGKFEEQLTKQCKVYLGDRVNPEPPDDLLINVKKCSVNLGPKMSPQSMMTSALVKSTAAGTGKNINFDKDIDDQKKEFKSVSFDVAGDSSFSQKFGMPVTEVTTALSVQNNPLFLQRNSILFPGDVSQAGKMCVEATLSMPPTSQIDADVATVVSSMTLLVSEQNPVQPVTSPSTSSETAVMSDVQHDLKPQTASSMCILQSTPAFQSVDSATSAHTKDSQNVTTVERILCERTGSCLEPVSETSGKVRSTEEMGTEMVITKKRQAHKPCSAMQLPDISEIARKYMDKIKKKLLHVAPAVNSGGYHHGVSGGVNSAGTVESVASAGDKCEGIHSFGPESKHPPVSDDDVEKTEITQNALDQREQLETLSSLVPSNVSFKLVDSSSYYERRYQSLEKPNPKFGLSFDSFSEVKAEERELVLQKQQLESNLDQLDVHSAPKPETSISNEETIEDHHPKHTLSFESQRESQREDTVPVGIDPQKMKQMFKSCAGKHVIGSLCTEDNIPSSVEDMHIDKKEEGCIPVVVPSEIGDSSTVKANKSSVEHDLGSMSMMEFLRKSAFTVPEPAAGGIVGSDDTGDFNSGNEKACFSCTEEYNAPAGSVSEHSDSCVAYKDTPVNSGAEHRIAKDTVEDTPLDSILEHHVASHDSVVEIAPDDTQHDTCAGSVVEERYDAQYNSTVEYIGSKCKSAIEHPHSSLSSAFVHHGTSLHSTVKLSDSAEKVFDTSGASLVLATDTDAPLGFTVKVHRASPSCAVGHHDGCHCGDHLGTENNTAPDTEVLHCSAAQLEKEQNTGHCDNADCDDIENDNWDTCEDRVKILAFSDENQTVTCHRVVSVSSEAENLLTESENTTRSATEEHNSSEVSLVDDARSDDSDSCETFMSASVLEPEPQLAATPVSLTSENIVRSSDNLQEHADISLLHDPTHEASKKYAEPEEHLTYSLIDNDHATRKTEEPGSVKCIEHCEKDLQQSPNGSPDCPQELLSYSPSDLQKPAGFSILDQNLNGKTAKSVKSEHVAFSNCAPSETESVVDKLDEASSPCNSVLPESKPHLMKSGHGGCSAADSADPKKSSEPDDSDDLPELCIVPDPEVIVIRKTFEQKPEKRRPPTPPSDDEGTVISAVIESHEVKIKNLRARSKKTSHKRSTFFARVETKPVLEETAEEPGPVEPLTRKPLLGVKPLRKVHKPEPFVWETDGDEDGKKLARNERSLKAFRQKAQVAPFKWDSDVLNQEKKDGVQEISGGNEVEVEGFQRDNQLLQASMYPDQSALLACNLESVGKCGTSDRKVSGSKTDNNKADIYGRTGPVETDLACTNVKDSSSATSKESDASKALLSRSSNSKAVKENISFRSVESDVSAPPAVSLRSKFTLETAKSPLALGSEAKKKEVVVSGASTYEADNTPQTVNSVTESARMTHRSRCTQRQGSFDKVFSGTPTRSTSRNRKTVYSTKGKRATFRKSRSCDTEDSNFVAELSPLRSAGHHRMTATSLAESDLRNKIESSTDSKNSSETSTIKNLGSCLEKTACSEPKSSQSKVKAHSFGTDPSPAFQKWRSRRSLLGSPVKEMETSNTSARKNIPVRPKIKHVRDASGQKAEAAKEEENASRPKQELCIEGIRPKAPDDGNVGTRSRHSSKNSKQQSKTADLNTNLKGLRSRDTTPDIVENQQSTDASKSLRSPEPGASKNSEEAGGGTAQDSTRANRRRVSGNSGPTLTTKTLRGSGDNSSQVATTKQIVERKTPRGSSSRESTPVSIVRANVSQIKTLGNPKLQRNREPRVGQVTSGRIVDQGVSTLQPRKQDLVIKSSPTASSLTGEQLVASSSTNVTPDSAEMMQTVACVAPKQREPGLKPTYLGAMVRRRQPSTSWRSSNMASQVKKTRLPTNKALQFEIFRVEPMQADSPTDQRKTRSSDRDVEPAPRTVHTRVSVNELKSGVSSMDTCKSGSDQKWSINRHITPAHMKRNSDPHFPFSFQRARRRTQKK